MQAEPRLAQVDAEALIHQVRTRLGAGPGAGGSPAVEFYAGPAAAREGGAGALYGGGAAAALLELHSLALGRLDPAIEALGGAPPLVPSLRGRAGGAAISLLRKLLWWYTGGLRGFGDALREQVRGELRLLETLVESDRAQRAEIAALREEVEALRARLERAP